MDTLKVAVLGLGVMGQTHARIYKEMPNAELVAVYDIAQEHASRIAESYNVTAAESLEELFAVPGLDAVSICTSDDQHKTLALLACKYGKHVLIEKPLADDLAEAEDIMNAVNESGIKMMVGHTLRWDPRYYQAWRAVQEGKIGKPLHFHARRNNSYQNGLRLKGRTSVIMFLAVHDIDVLEWILNDKIVEVYAIEVRERLQQFNVADAVVCTFKFASGAVGTYETSWVLPDHYSEIDAKLDLIGTQGVVNINIFSQNVVVHTDKHFTYPDTAYGVDLYGKNTGIMKEELSTFVSAVQENASFPISVEEAYRAVHIANCIEESIKLGRPVQTV
ncbi:Gfo/Idh/MocA family protein [Gordoniibacillus kamchatkensis]|uniref:Gfo/Idh/MocA family protein n=1 Tax=Gordoniibacillus kamchatkensis TaxID=1590651 RepID=UPI0018CCF6F7|nr:Gfo/Idh/MocA family oxidoreductase [Paenibacillus sp. VKM B-2647]